MNTTKKWALALSLALCFSKYSSADVTGNLIYTTPANPPPPGSVYSWSGFTLTESGGGGLSGGEVPAYNGALGQFMWGYTQGTVNYSMAVSSALSGTGIQVTGIEYGLQYFNQDWSRGTLSATWTLRGNGNNVLESYYHAFGATTEGWTNFDMTKTFTNPYSLSNIGNLDFSITGRDDRFWAGYYGPQVRNPYARLTYGADQCANNPLSSPSCAGFSDAMATRTAAPAAVDTVTATVEPVAAVTPARTTTATTTTTASAPAAAAPRATTAQPSAARVDAIVRSVQQSVADTTQATTEQSQAQATASQRASADTAGTDAPAAAFTRPGDPATAARGLASPIVADLPPEPRAQPRVVQPPAELAGGPSVVAFQAAVDITAYTNIILRDAPFYAPREIYRGQQTVDNARALRGLGTDRLHQDMVNQQYGR